MIKTKNKPPETFRGQAATIQKAINIRRILYQHDPLLWYKERFKAKPKDIDWMLYDGYEDHNWDGTKNPFKVAIEAIKIGCDVGIEAATGVGKTYIAAKIALWFLDVFPNAAVITTAPSREQLIQVLWKEISKGYFQFQKIRPKSELLTGELRVDKSRTYSNEIESADYSSRIISKVGRKRSGEDSSIPFQGIHNPHQLFIIDECAGIEHAVITAIKNTNTDKSKGSINSILALGNPDSQTDALHQFCLLDTTKHIIISAYDHPNIVSKEPIISGAVTIESIEIRKKEFKENSNLYRSRIRGIAAKQAVDSLIQYDWIMECCDNGNPQYVGVPDDDSSYNALGMDVANSESGDMACLAWGKKNELWWLHEFQCPNANHLAQNVVKDELELKEGGFKAYQTGNIKDFNIAPWNIGVDAVGVGAGTINEFDHPIGMEVQSLQGGCDESRIPKDAEGKPLYKFRNLRQQMYFQARLDLQNHKVRINLLKAMVFQQLLKELTLVKYKVTDGYMVIESKEDIKAKMGGKSPNLADAFVYWNWVRTIPNPIRFANAPIG